MQEHLVGQLLLTSLLVFLFTGALLGTALGLGLMIYSRGTLLFIRLMNYWVATPVPVEHLEAPRQVAPVASKSRGFGVALIVLGAYTTVVLLRSFDVEGLAALFKMDPRYSLGAIGLRAGKWILVLGGMVAVFIGVLLAFFPSAWRTIEAHANRWYSTRELEMRGNTPHMTLERLVEAFPRASGFAIFVLSLLTAVASATLVLRQ